jgi:hypothetical protein
MFQRMFLLVLNKLIRATNQQENKEIVEKFTKFFLNLISTSTKTTTKTTTIPCKKLNNKKNNVNESKPNIRFMSEYFTFLIEFSRSGIEQCLMLLKSSAIQKFSQFYLNNRRPQQQQQQQQQQ